jgi:hypothetical protein
VEPAEGSPDHLKGFMPGVDGLSSTVFIRDASGKEYKTSHNIVVETVFDAVYKVLVKKIAEVEAQISFEE